MSHKAPGRHRAPHQSAVRPLVRMSATLVASGGLVAAMSATAQAAPAAAVPSAVRAAAPAVSPARVAPWQTVHYGSRGAVVSRVQRVVGVSDDGIFGRLTLQAVKHWQSRHHLEADGIVGSKTAAAMKLTTATGGAASHNAATHKASASTGTRAQRVLAIAQQYTGIMYRWGGSTPAGFDCSGYTSYVFHKVGVNLPRTASDQQQQAKRVAHPEPGDLVFYGRPAYHVGIYAGSGYMYDSGRPGLTTQKRKVFSGVSGYGRV